MISVILAILTTLYTFARKLVVNDPLKGHVDTAINDANWYLIMMKDLKPSKTLDDLSKLSTKMILLSVLLFLPIELLLPKNIANELVKLPLALFAISVVLKLSIDWSQRHKESVKEMFFNIPVIVLLFAPITVYLLDLFLETHLFSKSFQYFSLLISTQNILLIQLLWFTTIVIVIYFCYWMVAAPVYFVLRALIFIFSSIIDKVHKHLNPNVLDVICGVTVLIVILLKVVNL